MRIINLFAAPSSGKSVAAALLFAKLKCNNIKSELIGEHAKELVYRGNEIQLGNQVYLLGTQYRRAKDLERSGIDIAIADSPILMQTVYCKKVPYYTEIKKLIDTLNSEFDNINIFIHRATPYQTYGRVNSEEDSNKLAKDIYKLIDKWDLEIDGNEAGTNKLCDYVLNNVVFN